jgi:hypothetical protein
MKKEFSHLMKDAVRAYEDEDLVEVLQRDKLFQQLRNEQHIGSFGLLLLLLGGCIVGVFIIYIC